MLIDPTNQPHLYRALLHQDSMTLENADVQSANETPNTPTNQPQVYRALLHQDSMTLQNADIPTANVLLNPPLWNQVLQKCTTVGQYDIAQCRHVPNADLTTLANQAQVYRTLLHQENITLQNADVHSADLPHSPLTGMCSANSVTT